MTKQRGSRAGEEKKWARGPGSGVGRPETTQLEVWFLGNPYTCAYSYRDRSRSSISRWPRQSAGGRPVQPGFSRWPRPSAGGRPVQPGVSRCTELHSRGLPWGAHSTTFDERYIHRTRAALCRWLLTCGRTPVCLCKPLTCRACPGTASTCQPVIPIPYPIVFFVCSFPWQES